VREAGAGGKTNRQSEREKDKISQKCRVIRRMSRQGQEACELERV
jgi:hypothetical protein